MTKMRIAVVLGALVTLAGLSVAALGTVYWMPRGHTEPVTVNIKPGSSIVAIGRVLQAMGLINAPLGFRVAVKLRGDENRLQAGEFEIPPRASLAQIIDHLRDGRPIMHAITLAEGLTSQQIINELNGHKILDGVVAQIPAEGSLLPETYFVPRGTRRSALIADMQRAMQVTLDTAWESRQEGLPIKTKQEALILASIVEKETGIPEERRDVAAVFVNRLRRGMKLQSDPTIIYGLVGGQGKLGRPIRKSEIRKPTPYNTYTIEGLPPTPIANPGRAAIEAVMGPSKSKAVFFVADGTGGHVFAETYRDHRANVKKWRAIEKARKTAQ